jgi:hypothetical protein
MNVQRLIRALLQLYPDEWRAEYGAELASLLSLQPITPSVFVDVVLSATRQRWKRDKVWMVCGISLFAWTTFVICLNNTGPLSPVTPGSCEMLSLIIVLLAGCLTVLRKSDASPSWAAVRAALLGTMPETVALAFWARGIFHPLVTKAAGPFPLLESRLAMVDMTFPTVPQPGFGMVPLVITLIVVQACVIGFIGGLLGRLILFFSTRLRLS